MSARCEAEGPLLGDEDDDDATAAEDADMADEASDFLKQMQSDASMVMDTQNAGAGDHEDGTGPEVDFALLDLGSVPDKEELRQIFQETVTAESPPHDIRENNVELPEEIPKNLHHAMLLLTSRSTEEEIFDALFRLTMYLRHWKGGCDRSFVKNPRITRTRSAELNWYQFLGFSGRFQFFRS